VGGGQRGRAHGPTDGGRKLQVPKPRVKKEGSQSTTDGKGSKKDGPDGAAHKKVDFRITVGGKPRKSGTGDKGTTEKMVKGNPGDR